MDTTKLILDLLVGGGSHGFLIVGLIVLYREYKSLQAENASLHRKLEDIRQAVASTHAVTLKQNDTLSEIKSQTNGGKGHFS